MKRLFAMVLVFVMLLAFVGCKSNTNPSESQDTQGTVGNNTQGTTQGENSSVFEGEVTEAVVRNYKVASETDFIYEDVAGGVRITGYKGKDVVVVIPEEIAGKTVVSMSINSFGTNCAVRGVLIPSGVKELEGVFGNNVNLEVVIWESAENAGANLFNSCAKLHTVIFGDKLINIGENAFFYCASLEELYIPASVQSLNSEIAPSIFYLCAKLTIKGAAGSYIETFCNEWGIAFEAV